MEDNQLGNTHRIYFDHRRLALHDFEAQQRRAAQKQGPLLEIVLIFVGWPSKLKTLQVGVG